MRARWEFRADRRFHRGHVWAMAVDAHVRVGLDPFAAELLGRVISVVFPPLDSILNAGEPGCWLVDETGPVAIRMPVSGRVARVNRSLADRPAAAAERPLDEGWLLEIACRKPRSALAGLLTGTQMRRQTRSDWAKLQKKARARVRRPNRKLGPTMQDGGERVDDLRKIVSPQQFRRLVMDTL